MNNSKIHNRRVEQNIRWLSKKKTCKKLSKKSKKVVEINGNRLEQFHLNEIRKEIEDEECIKKMKRE